MAFVVPKTLPSSPDLIGGSSKRHPIEKAAPSDRRSIKRTKPITRPKPKRIKPPHVDPTSPDYISPREERRLRRELLRRVDRLFDVAEAKGYGPAPEKFIKPRTP